MIMPLVIGLAGVAVLVSLGLWQVQRLAWKEAVLAAIDARIGAVAVEVPAAPDPVADQYLPVQAAGQFVGQEIDVLVSRKEIGAGYRIIAVLETVTGRRLLVDRGFIRDEARGLPREATAVEVTGNLLWPQEVDSYTPAPDAKTGVWFARDLAALAGALETEPVLIVARSDTGDGVEPMPVDSSAIPNDHLTYAITWFSLALIWLGMTSLWLWRIRRRTD